MSSAPRPSLTRKSDAVKQGGFAGLRREVVACRRCERLVLWREKIAKEKTRRFAGEEYWGKPLPGFGDPEARLLLVGLAPAAHGGNRTGRMFTGDQSGDWLVRALHTAGFATLPASVNRTDGLTLIDCYMTATCRCAPPQNTLLPDEVANCRPFLLREISLLKNVHVVVGLGRVGFESALAAYRALGRIEYPKKPRFAHCATYALNDLTFVASYHPSQQNTFTGRLTRPMLDRVFREARRALARTRT